ncbi:MAG: M1 family metallopeptidase [Cryomorphaceae bacterium]|nr:M1 family metallopeptidase [Cryomorphaceae bacterium]
MRITRILLLLIFLVLFADVFAQDLICYPEDKRGPARDHQVNFLHLRADLDIYPFEHKVSGTVDLTFSPLRKSVDSLWLDAPNIDIKEVRVRGKKVAFVKEDNGIHVIARSPWLRGNIEHMRITYVAYPRKGLYFSGWNDDPKHGQVWSQGQGIDNRHWLPHFDALNNKLTSEIIVRFDSAYQVVSNGKLIAERPLKDGRKEWHWQQTSPHSSYLIMLGIGNFKFKDSQSGSGVPMRHYYYPEWEKNASWVYKYTEEIMDWLEEETGVNYPWVNYKQVPIRDFIYGAMENTTATIFKDVFYTDSAHFDAMNYVFINAHEMAHQWFGNLVTAWSAQHHWLQESFATYYHFKVQEAFMSPDKYDFQRHSASRAVKYASLMSNLPVAHSNAGSARHYFKGALVLAMLEDKVGTENFRDALTLYLRRYAYDNARSDNLKDAMHRISGVSLDTFFDQWIYRDGEPHLELKVNEGKNGHWLVFSQDSSKLNNPRMFQIDIPYEVFQRRNKSERRVFTLKSEVDSVFVPGKPRFVIVDPRKRLLVHWKMDMPQSWWMQQWYEAPYAIDRRWGYQQYKEAKMTFELAGAEPFEELRAYYFSEVLSDTVPEHELFQWVNDPYYNVRLIAYQAVAKLPEQNRIPWYERGLNDVNESIRAYCLEKVLPYWTPEQAMPKLMAIRPNKDFDMGQFRWTWYKAMLQQYDPGDEGQYRKEVEYYFEDRHMSDWRMEALNIIAEYEWWSDDNIRRLYTAFAHYDRGLRKESQKHIDKLRKLDASRMDKILDELYKKGTPQQRERWDKLKNNE